jgi:hypothetical protein
MPIARTIRPQPMWFALALILSLIPRTLGSGSRYRASGIVSLFLDVFKAVDNGLRGQPLPQSIPAQAQFPSHGSRLVRVVDWPRSRFFGSRQSQI